MSSSDKRATVFPGSASGIPGSASGTSHKRSLPEDKDDSHRLSISKLPRVVEPNYQRSHLLAPPLKVNPISSQFTQSSRFPRLGRTTTREPWYHEQSPWVDYYEIFEEQQAGRVRVAYKQEKSHEIVAIRQQKCSDRKFLDRLRQCHHDNVVTLHTAYLDDETISLVYDVVDVSLAEMQSTPLGSFADYQIAAICQKVITMEKLGRQGLTLIGAVRYRVRSRPPQDRPRICERGLCNILSGW